MADINEEIEKLTIDKVKPIEPQPGEVTTAPPPELTKEQILQAAGLLQEKETNGGYRKIAEIVGGGIKPSQVKKIHKAMKKREAELIAGEVE